MKNHSPAELEARLRLHGLPELGPMRFLRLIEAFGSASSALAAPASAWRTLGVPAEAAAARRSPAVREAAGEALRWLEGPRRHLLMWDDPGYPALLAEVADAPPLLYVEGAPETLERPQLAMVGSRRASPAGLGTARALRAAWRRAASPSPAGWPWASMAPPTRARWRLAARPWQSSAPACAGSIRGATRRWRGASSRVAARWFRSCRWTARRCRQTFPGATASSADSRWVCWWSRQVPPAAR